jgi:hypothetical protein
MGAGDFSCYSVAGGVRQFAFWNAAAFDSRILPDFPQSAPPGLPHFLQRPLRVLYRRFCIPRRFSGLAGRVPHFIGAFPRLDRCPIRLLGGGAALFGQITPYLLKLVFGAVPISGRFFPQIYGRAPDFPRRALNIACGVVRGRGVTRISRFLGAFFRADKGILHAL